MEKKLPNVYANNIEKKINNVQELFYGNNKYGLERKSSINDVIKKINEIFNSPNHVYKSDVVILINDKEVEKTIVGKTNNSLLTINGETIKISDISDIKKRI